MVLTIDTYRSLESRVGQSRLHHPCFCLTIHFDKNFVKFYRNQNGDSPRDNLINQRVTHIKSWQEDGI